MRGVQEAMHKLPALQYSEYLNEEFPGEIFTNHSIKVNEMLSKPNTNPIQLNATWVEVGQCSHFPPQQQTYKSLLDFVGG